MEDQAGSKMRILHQQDLCNKLIPQSTPASKVGLKDQESTAQVVPTIEVPRHNISVLSNADTASMAPSSWSQRAFMQTFTIAVIDSPVACVGVDLSSKACLPLPKLVSDISGIVYHDQHQQIRSLYQRRLRDGSNVPSCFADRPSTTIIQGVILIMTNTTLVLTSLRF
ncbi:putative f-box domain-containing protein [Botrytis fragariae]|uniref:Putative f-box domain-containing protein n=1 Tax=Botrytis fragariae TaxID=1964551 RepID=A0A8H6EI82_9HELO|nr:putative f-box domain-containing protein [Botrytis fragariae]KAF5873198.1 putative f-box domain-containing protein [Botrytis fragariae]